MEFEMSITKENLAKAFAGESQARNRYDFLAEEFLNVGYYALSQLLKHIAKNEEAHAKVFYDYIINNCGGCNNIEISTGYPFKGGDLLQNLKNAIENEREEGELIYLQFSETAKKEGFADIAVTFSNIAKIELKHKDTLLCLANKLEKGMLYKSTTIANYECENCGYNMNGLDAFKVCPVCKHNQGFVAINC